MASKRRRREDEFAYDHQSDLKNLRSDILFEIYKHLDDDNIDNEFELRRMRSVCTSWRSSLLPLKKPLQFPLKLPPPPSSLYSKSGSNGPFTTAHLSRSNILLFPPPSGVEHQESGWIVRVEQRAESSILCLENPLLMLPASFEHPTLFRGSFDMIECNVKEITKSYWFEYGRNNEQNPRKAKAVVCWNNNSKDKYDDFTVLVLFEVGKLGLWRPGEAEWSIIPDPFIEIRYHGDEKKVINNSFFSDTINFEGKFYAITREARLIMIDPTTYEVSDLITVELDLISVELDLKCELLSYLVESNGQLYLVYKEHVYLEKHKRPRVVGVCKLETYSGKNNNQTCTWKVVSNIEDRVFYVSEYVTFSIAMEGLGWPEGNYVLLPCDHSYGLRTHRFFSVDENLIDDKIERGKWYSEKYFGDCLPFYRLEDSKIGFERKEVAPFAKIFWPPPDWLLSKLM